MPVFLAYIDGASHGNPGEAGIGVVIYNEKREPLRAFGYFLGKLTNNMAEYMALILALMALRDLGAEAATIYSDSELLVRQLNGEYRVKNERLLPFYLEVKFFLRSFQEVKFCHLNREENKLADRLANRAISEKGYVS